MSSRGAKIALSSDEAKIKIQMTALPASSLRQVPASPTALLALYDIRDHRSVQHRTLDLTLFTNINQLDTKIENRATSSFSSITNLWWMKTNDLAPLRRPKLLKTTHHQKTGRGREQGFCL
jgi:hypothetical protein